MSTLRVSTIQDTAGSNSSTPSQIASGRAKAWVNFNGTGVVAIRAQYNVSSITDGGAGLYTVNFTSAMSDANYSAVRGDDSRNIGELSSFTTSSVAVSTRNGAMTLADTAIISVTIFR